MVAPEPNRNPGPPSGATADAGGAAPTFRVGTLTYTRLGLFAVFWWLLAGEVVYILLDQVDPKILPILLKEHHASDRQVALLINSFAAIANILINPVFSYWSDRTRTRWGRRIPFLFWTTPLVTVGLVLTPFAPEIGRALARIEWVHRWLAGTTWTPTLLAFGVIVGMYQIAQKVIGSVFFYIIPDVIPASHLGRFLTLFRVFGALATFGLNYWLLGLSETHAREVFIVIAVFNLVGYMALCRFVREGEYPPVEQVRRVGSGRWRLVSSVRDFVVKAFTSRLYWWVYLHRVTMTGAFAVMPFVLYFAHEELGMSYDRTGKLMAWASAAWLLVAYPMGLLMDRWPATRVMALALWIQTITCAASFCFIEGEATFLVSSTLSGVAYWMLMIGGFKLICDLFSKQRLGQLASASALLNSLFVLCVVTPLIVWLFAALKGMNLRLALPGFAPMTVGHYRYSFLLMALMYAVSLFALERVRRLWLAHGGPDAYVPPDLAGGDGRA